MMVTKLFIHIYVTGNLSCHQKRLNVRYKGEISKDKDAHQEQHPAWHKYAGATELHPGEWRLSFSETERVRWVSGGVIYLSDSTKHTTSESTEHTATEMEICGVWPQLVDLTDLWGQPRLAPMSLINLEVPWPLLGWYEGCDVPYCSALLSQQSGRCRVLLGQTH